MSVLKGYWNATKTYISYKKFVKVMRNGSEDKRRIEQMDSNDFRQQTR
jgi:hypothetical protein